MEKEWIRLKMKKIRLKHREKNGERIEKNS